MSRDFNKWLTTFKQSIADWTYYTDFPKVYRNVHSIKVELNILNSLIKSNNIEEEFAHLVSKYPEVLKAIPILLAKRESDILISQPEGTQIYNFNNSFLTINQYVEFMRNTGLFELLSNHLISDLTDYVRGVEVGLDTNARKNRTGKAMENIVEKHLISLGFQQNISYFPQLKASQILSRFGVDVTNLDSEHKAEKVFDFVVKTDKMIYGIEVNFYSGGGSKLNETARSFKMIAQESKNVQGFKFVWITDGIGWNSARRNLEETFYELDEIYNLNDLENGLLKELLK